MSLFKTVSIKPVQRNIKYFSKLFFFLIIGIIKGDEIIVINGAIVSDLDMMYLESVLQEEQSLCMMMRLVLQQKKMAPNSLFNTSINQITDLPE